MKTWRVLKILSLLLIGFTLGLFFGLREGGMALYMIDVVPKGVLSTMYLRELEKQNLKPIKHSLDTDIDQGLYYYSLTKDAWWYPLLRSGLILPFDEAAYSSYVNKLANYRKQHPSPILDPHLFETVPEDKQQYKEDYKELDTFNKDLINRIRKTIDEHANP